MIDFITKIRYIKPLEAIWDSRFIGTISGTIGVFIEYTTDFFANLFSTDVELLVLLIIAILFDLLFGLAANKRRKNPVSSIGLRQSIVKIIEYSAILILFIGIANGYGKYIDEGGAIGFLTPLIMHADVFAFLFLTIIEIVSISENMLDEGGTVKKMVNEFKNKIGRNASE